MVPDLIMRALFTRGAFTTADAQAAAATLRPMRSDFSRLCSCATRPITFLARGRHRNAREGAAVSVAVNVGSRSP